MESSVVNGIGGKMLLGLTLYVGVLLGDFSHKSILEEDVHHSVFVL